MDRRTRLTDFRPDNGIDFVFSFGCEERFDAVVFLDLPGEAEKQAIWNLYLDYYELDRSQTLPNDAQWTGAEIKACPLGNTFEISQFIAWSLVLLYFIIGPAFRLRLLGFFTAGCFPKDTLDEQLSREGNGVL